MIFIGLAWLHRLYDDIWASLEIMVILEVYLIFLCHLMHKAQKIQHNKVEEYQKDNMEQLGLAFRTYGLGFRVEG